MKQDQKEVLKTLKLKYKFALTLSALTGIAFLPTIIAACGSYVVIDSRGSSSVQPLMAALGNEYSNDHNVEISVQAGGSSNGIQWVASGLTTLGNSSKNPKDTVLSSPDLQKNWKDKNIKTVSIAKDGIGIVYKLPDGYTADDFAISQDNIAKLYEGFAGFTSVTLSNFYIGLGVAPNPDVVIHGFARTGGSTASGTAEAFLKDSGFDLGNSVSKAVSNSLSTGQYGPNTKSTSESNAEAYSYFKSNATKPGSMIYLSLGYIQNNLASIQQDGFAILNYKNPSDGTIYAASLKNVEDNNYKWFRPLDTMIALNSTSKPKLDSAKKFIEWILFGQYIGIPLQEQKNIENIYVSEGAIPLTDKEKIKMFNIDVSSIPGYTSDPAVDLKTLVTSYMNDFWQGDLQFSTVTFGL